MATSSVTDPAIPRPGYSTGTLTVASSVTDPAIPRPGLSTGTLTVTSSVTDPAIPRRSRSIDGRMGTSSVTRFLDGPESERRHKPNRPFPDTRSQSERNTG
jgi:hypothetical protein